MKLVVQRELIPFRALLKETYAREVYDQAMEHVKTGREHYYNESFLGHCLVSRSVLHQLPRESFDEMMEGFQRLDSQCPYVMEGELDDDCFMEFRIIRHETIPSTRILRFYNRAEDNLLVEPDGISRSMNRTDLNMVISVVFNALWPLVDENLVNKDAGEAVELIIRFNGIRKTLYSYIPTHSACRNDLAKQYINGMKMIERILQRYDCSFVC